MAFATSLSNDYQALPLSASVSSRRFASNAITAALGCGLGFAIGDKRLSKLLHDDQPVRNRTLFDSLSQGLYRNQQSTLTEERHLLYIWIPQSAKPLEVILCFGAYRLSRSRHSSHCPQDDRAQ